MKKLKGKKPFLNDENHTLKSLILKGMGLIDKLHIAADRWKAWMTDKRHLECENQLENRHKRSRRSDYSEISMNSDLLFKRCCVGEQGTPSEQGLSNLSSPYPTALIILDGSTPWDTMYCLVDFALRSDRSLL